MCCIIPPLSPSLVLAVGVLGNCLVILVITTSQSMRSSTNIFLLNLRQVPSIYTPTIPTPTTISNIPTIPTPPTNPTPPTISNTPTIPTPPTIHIPASFPPDSSTIPSPPTIPPPTTILIYPTIPTIPILPSSASSPALLTCQYQQCAVLMLWQRCT